MQIETRLCVSVYVACKFLPSSLSMQNSSAALNCAQLWTLYLSPVISGHFSTPFPAAAAAAAKLYTKVSRECPCKCAHSAISDAFFFFFFSFFLFLRLCPLQRRRRRRRQSTVASFNSVLCVCFCILVPSSPLADTTFSQPGNLLPSKVRGHSRLRLSSLALLSF